MIDDEFDISDADLARFRRRGSVQALTTLLTIMRDQKAAPTARTQAARAVLADATARRHDQVDGKQVDEMTQAELLTAIRAKEAQLAAITASTARSEAEDAEFETVTSIDDDVFG